MGRLIDADKLKVYLKEYLHYDHAIPWVDAQPTAYDIEKVVAELEKYEEQPIQRPSDIVWNNAINMCLEIVRKGGVE